MNDDATDNDLIWQNDEGEQITQYICQLSQHNSTGEISRRSMLNLATGWWGGMPQRASYSVPAVMAPAMMLGLLSVASKCEPFHAPLLVTRMVARWQLGLLGWMLWITKKNGSGEGRNDYPSE